MKISILFFLLVLSFNSMAKTDKVLATVNGRKITQSQFDSYFNQRLLFVSNKKVTKASVLTELVNTELGISHAIKKKVDKDPVVKRKIDELMYHAQISKDLEKKFKKIKVTDDSVKAYYGKNKEYRTSHILFRLRANPSAKDVKTILTQSKDIYNKVLKKPEAFAQYASKFSQTGAAQVGGDLGYQPPTRYAPEYFKAINGKTVGYISRPVRTQYGYHIIKVLGVKKLKDINKNLYKKIVYDIKRDKIIDDYHNGLRKKSKVKVFEKFSD
jgi:parvulin-like peptidyl-prolyl isomerase